MTHFNFKYHTGVNSAKITIAKYALALAGTTSLLMSVCIFLGTLVLPPENALYWIPYSSYAASASLLIAGALGGAFLSIRHFMIQKQMAKTQEKVKKELSHYLNQNSEQDFHYFVEQSEDSNTVHVFKNEGARDAFLQELQNTSSSCCQKQECCSVQTS